MSEKDKVGDVAFRLRLLERATAENTRRLAEIGRALAETRAAKEPSINDCSREFTIDADSVSPFAAGFYYRQMDDAGRPYRWTGRGDFFELRFALNRNIAWKFWVELQGNEHVSLTQLRGFVDYAEVPLDFEAPDGLSCGTIPVRALSNLVVMTFYLPGHFVPTERDPSSTDSRTLGAVFYGVKLAPLNSPDGAGAQRDGDAPT